MEARKFCRFANDRSTAEGYWPMVPDGLCLSSFLLLSPPDRPGEVLVGRIDPRGPWESIGALDPRRVAANVNGWMLPSCHLRYFEPPDEAARRILQEQLGAAGIALSPPEVHSEVYPPKRHPDHGEHWDLEFLFRGTWTHAYPPHHAAWTELRFVDPARTPRGAFTRSHDEVLELAGYSIG